MSLFQAIARFKRPFVELRQSIREHVQFPAWVDIGDGSRLRRCEVLDVSEGGARIMVSFQDQLPKEFWLVLTSDRTRRHRVGWSGAPIRKLASPILETFTTISFRQH